MLLGLQRTIAEMDAEGLNIIGSDFHRSYPALLVQRVEESGGQIFVAVAQDCLVGFIAGVQESYDRFDELSYSCPKEGRFLELFVCPAYRKQHVGAALMAKMEEYFRQSGCEAVRVEVFAPNEAALHFYSRYGYRPRTMDLRHEL